MQSYVIHMIRNAPSEGNLEGRYIGRSESPISISGIETLIDLKQSYHYPDAQGFYASPATRFVDSLRILYPEADPEVVLEMAESDFGDWEGKTADELANDEDFNIWLQNSAKASPPNGESGEVFTMRVMKGFNMLVQNVIHKNQTSSVLVTSGTIIMTILASCAFPRANFYEWMCEPGCGYSIRITPSLYMRSGAVEAFALVPEIPRDERKESIIDLAREAADRAWRGEDDEPESDDNNEDSDREELEEDVEYDSEGFKIYDFFE